MEWKPILGIAMGLFFAFDAFRAVNDDGFWGRPWPGVSRDENAPFFWAAQTMRIVVSVGFIVVSSLWLIELASGGD